MDLSVNKLPTEENAGFSRRGFKIASSREGERFVDLSSVANLNNFEMTVEALSEGITGDKIYLDPETGEENTRSSGLVRSGFLKKKMASQMPQFSREDDEEQEERVNSNGLSNSDSESSNGGHRQIPASLKKRSIREENDQIDEETSKVLESMFSDNDEEEGDEPVSREIKKSKFVDKGTDSENGFGLGGSKGSDRPNGLRGRETEGSLYKKKVYVASLDSIATIYEDSGNLLTVRLANGKWREVKRAQIEIISEGNEGEGVPFLSPRKRNNGGDTNDDFGIRDKSNDASPASYAEKRRAKLRGN